MKRKILLLCDSFSIADEVITYSVGLAKRQNLGLILMLLVSPSGENESRPLGEGRSGREHEAGGKVLADLRERIDGAGVEVEILERTGDPVSEFLKFMAGGVSIYSIIWGGDEEAMRESGALSRNHWVHKIKGLVECPWVVPSRKS